MSSFFSSLTSLVFGRTEKERCTICGEEIDSHVNMSDHIESSCTRVAGNCVDCGRCGDTFTKASFPSHDCLTTCPVCETDVRISGAKTHLEECQRNVEEYNCPQCGDVVKGGETQIWKHACTLVYCKQCECHMPRDMYEEHGCSVVDDNLNEATEQKEFNQQPQPAADKRSTARDEEVAHNEQGDDDSTENWIRALSHLALKGSHATEEKRTGDGRDGDTESGTDNRLEHNNREEDRYTEHKNHQNRIEQKNTLDAAEEEDSRSAAPSGADTGRTPTPTPTPKRQESKGNGDLQATTTRHRADTESSPAQACPTILCEDCNQMVSEEDHVCSAECVYCHEMIPMFLLDVHCESDCEQRPIQCSTCFGMYTPQTLNGHDCTIPCGSCGESVRCSHLNVHVTHNCVNRAITCTLCGRSVAFNRLTTHECKVVCPLCQSMVQSRDIGTHLKNECMERDVLCKICGTHMPAKDLSHHRCGVNCKFCHSPIPAHEIRVHESDICGMRLVECPLCLRFVESRILNDHIDIHKEEEEKASEQLRQQEEDRKEQELSCAICYDGPKELVFIPCGHVCCCKQCGKELGQSRTPACPICRKPITAMQHLYFT